MASQFEAKYRTKGHVLNDDYFNRRWRDVDSRLVALEDAIANLDAARDKLVQLGLAQLNSQIDAAIESLQGLINGAQQDLSETNAEVAAINAQLTALADAVADIISGGTLPASVITVAAIPGIAAGDVQAALAELQGDVTAINALVAGLQFGSIVVPNVTARNALTGLVKGDVVFVQDDGAGKWAQYQITSDGDGTWGGVSKTLVLVQDTYLPLSGGTMTGFVHVDRGSTFSKAFQANFWGLMNGGADGRAVFGSNPYSHFNGAAVEYRLANTHASVGYAAIRMVANTLEFAGAVGATTQDAVVTPTWRTIWHSGNFDPATKVNKAGDSFNGDVHRSGTAGTVRSFAVSSATLVRWSWGANADAESGGNAGSNFFINRFNDAGAYIDTPFFIDRVTGALTVNYLWVKAQGGVEGGEIVLAKPQSGSTLDGTGVIVDVNANEFRIFESGGSFRGVKLDLSQQASGVGSKLLTSSSLATASDMEAATDLTRPVTPGLQHRHPGHPKAWGRVQSDGTLIAGYNVGSVSRASTGYYVITFTNALANGNYSVTITIETAALPSCVPMYNNAAAGGFDVQTQRASNDAALDRGFSFAVFGDM